MKPFRSLRWRLQFWYGVVLLAVLAGFGVTAYEYQRIELWRRTDEELERRAGAWARRLQNPGEPGRADAPELEIADESPGGSWYAVRWRDKGGRREASAAAPASVPRPQRSEMKPSGPTLRARGDYREAVLHAGPGDYIVTGRDMARASAELHRFGCLLAGAAAGILAAGLAVGGVVTGRALRPLKRIAGAAREIADGEWSRRVPTENMDAEPLALAEVLNDTFARLEEALARQKRFTADAAHELRTPVAVVLLQAQGALAVDGGDPAHREALEACERAARRMRALTEALLRLARLEAGSADAPRRRVDLADRARETARLLAPLAERAGVALALELAEAPVSGDEEALDQLITNLATNAIVHGGAGGRVELVSWVEDGEARIEVRDAGPGIPEGEIDGLFERFTRLDGSRSRASGGVGLGLAICRAIATAHGGRVSARNRPDGGAVFSVSLPRAEL